MPSALCRLCPCPCPCPGCWPRGFGGRRPPRLLLRPPPPEGLPGPAFIVLSKFLLPDFDSYQFLPDSNCALGESSCPASAAALGPLPGARLRNRVPYAVRTHKCRAHIWAQSPTLETTLFCANQTDLFAYRFSDFGSVAPPREGLAWKACAGTRPNENTLILLAPAARRKGHRGGLLHRRTWLVEMASGFGYRTGGSADRLIALGLGAIKPEEEAGTHIPAEISRAHCCASRYILAVSSLSRCMLSATRAAASHSPLS